MGLSNGETILTIHLAVLIQCVTYGQMETNNVSISCIASMNKCR